MTKQRKKMLEVNKLRQHFRLGSGSTRIDIKAVDGLTFDIYEGEVFGLVGESGCGKTTTGRSIIKLYTPTDGTVTFDGKVIGAGYSGNLRNIRFAKRDAKLATIKTDDYRYQRYLIKTNYKDIIKSKKQELKDIKSNYKEKLTEIKGVNDQITIEVDAVKSEVALKVSELQHAAIIEIDRINTSMKKDITHDYKISVQAAKRRFNQKKSYLPESMLSKEEKQLEYIEFGNEYLEQIKRIEDRYLRRLDKYNPSRYVRTATKFYKRRLRKTVNQEEYELITGKIAELDNYIIDDNIKEASPEQKRNEIHEIEKVKRKEIEKLKKEEQKQIAKLNKGIKSKESLNPQIESAKNTYLSARELLKSEISKARISRRNELRALKLDRKENPDKYTVDKEEKRNIKLALRETIRNERAEIRRLKKLNKIKETPEEKEAKLLKIQHIEESYAEEIRKLEVKVSNKDVEVHNNSDNKKLKEELSLLKKQLREVKIELSREVEKANIANSYAGVMSQLQMIFQDPVSSLNPRKTVKEIISEGLIIQGIKDNEYIDRKVAESLNLVGLSPNHASRYPHEFSGGQRQRIGIARALIVNPKFLIADEPISALDVSIQAQIINLLKDLKDELGLTILFIAHDLSVVKYFSDRIAVMYFGKIVEQTTSEELFKNPLHPYTKSLLSAIPNPDPHSEKTRVRTTYDPSMHDYSIDKPEMVEIKPGHFIYANKAEVEMYKKQLKESQGVK